jgi:hypothetical protein
VTDDHRPVSWYRSARKHRIGKAHAQHVMNTTEPTFETGTDGHDGRLMWFGPDDRGLVLEVIALDLPEEIIVIHVMPYNLRRRKP